MFNIIKKIFKKEEEFDSTKKFKVKVYNVYSGRFLGETEMDWNEYKYKVAFDKYNRYSRVEKE